jgi:hypothetical protein
MYARFAYLHDTHAIACDNKDIVADDIPHIRTIKLVPSSELRTPNTSLASRILSEATITILHISSESSTDLAVHLLSTIPTIKYCQCPLYMHTSPTNPFSAADVAGTISTVVIIDGPGDIGVPLFKAAPLAASLMAFAVEVHIVMYDYVHFAYVQAIIDAPKPFVTYLRIVTECETNIVESFPSLVYLDAMLSVSSRDDSHDSHIQTVMRCFSHPRVQHARICTIHGRLWFHVLSLHDARAFFPSIVSLAKDVRRPLNLRCIHPFESTKAQFIATFLLAVDRACQPIDPLVLSRVVSCLDATDIQ